MAATHFGSDSVTLDTGAPIALAGIASPIFAVVHSAAEMTSGLSVSRDGAARGATAACAIIATSKGVIMARDYGSIRGRMIRTSMPLCVLHDVGLAEPTYLVLEFLEGETLATRIARGPLPFEKDGGTLVYLQRHQRGDWDVLSMPLTGAHTPVPLVATTADEGDARLSPDARVLAFVSDETDHREVYVAPFPHPSPKLRISPAGGRVPRWSDAHTLLFLADDGHIMRTAVTTDGGLHAGTRVPAFARAQELPWRDFLPFPGGRFLAIVPEGLAREQLLTVITQAVR